MHDRARDKRRGHVGEYAHPRWGQSCTALASHSLELSRVQQRVLTLASFADVMRLPEALCRLPWAHERVLWIGAHDESSLWHKLSPELLRFVVSAACGTWWVKHAAAEVVARLGVESDERDR